MRDGLGRKLLASLMLGLIVALVVGMVAVLLLGRPPTTFKLAAGQPSGMYAAFASSLKDELASMSISVEVLETAGSVENAQLLRTGEADVGLIQSGTEYLTDIGGSTALSEVFYEPFWIFTRQGVVDVVEGIPVLAGKRLAIGTPGSGTNAVARALIDQTGSTAIPVEWTTDEAIEGLAAGTIDAAFLVVAANAPLIAELAAVPDLEILAVPNVEGLARRLPFLSPVLRIPPGRWPPRLRERLRGMGGMLLGALTMLIALPGALRWFALEADQEARHPVDQEHWHLAWVGVHPAFRRRGVASALAEYVIEKADAAGVGCYVETYGDATEMLYRRYGFEVRETWDAPDGGPRGRSMWRDARPRSAGQPQVPEDGR